MTDFRLALVSMPWAIFDRPSIQLGALKSYVERNSSIKVETFHPYLNIAKILGKDLYHLISSNVWICEAFYSGVLFPELRLSAKKVVEKELRKVKSGIPVDFDAIRARLASHLAEWAAATDWQRFDLVGFSVCFNQLLATLAAVSSLKKKHADLPIVLGGSACHADSAPAFLRHFPADFVISGEGEEPLLSLCATLAGRAATLDDRVWCAAGLAGKQPAHQGKELDIATLPCPDYDDYFREMRQLFAGEVFIPVIPVEFSRGCWWRKCSFCNLNLQWRGYRHKGAAKMATEVFALADRHKVLDFAFTDNALPPKDAVSFFEKVRGSGLDLRFFAEIRADHRGRVMEISRHGGLTSVQVGIEAFSNSLLEKMSKGVTVIENLAVMKDALAHGVELAGNLIVEFPGSSKEEVDETMAVLDFAFPFRPLTTASFFLGHGSPVDCRPADYGIRAKTTHPYISKLFPSGIGADLPLLVKGYKGDRARQRKLWAPVVAKVKRWRDYHRKPGKTAGCLLSYRDGGDFLIIRQVLPDGKVLRHRLLGVSRQIYLSCAAIVDLPALALQFPSFPRDKIEKFLDDLVAKRLVFKENNRFLSLAVRQGY
ncbi:MAG: RiPP maturation radical SAM protein 1 [Deltaproteobacteria bacterium]|nr:RiPP maturation radical SAM protein 1 [Deltaproteobacteria bacterium]